MLVNPSGRDGHNLAIDMNIEHLIGYLKVIAVSLLYSHLLISFLGTVRS